MGVLVDVGGGARGWKNGVKELEGVSLSLRDSVAGKGLIRERMFTNWTYWREF